MFSSRKCQLNRYHSQGDPRWLALSLADSLQEVMTISAHGTFLAIPAANQKVLSPAFHFFSRESESLFSYLQDGTKGIQFRSVQ